jgi:hypothetical protein
MNSSLNPAHDDDERRLRAYRGELMILPPSASSSALVELARDLSARRTVAVAFLPKGAA